MNVRALVVGSGVAVVALSLLAVPAEARPATTATTTYTQASTVTAVAMQSVNEQQPAPISGIDRPFSAYAAYVAGNLDSTGVSDARAAVATPGTGVEQGINELFAVGGCTACPPVDNPTEAYASYPATNGVQSTQSKAQAIGPVGAAAGTATAAAQQATNTATATASGTSLLGGTTAALSTGSLTSSLTQTVTPDGLVVTATSAVSSISIAGLVTVDGVTATASQTRRDGRVVAHSATVTLGKVTALGQPAAIDSTGVHVLSAGDSGQALSTLNGTLASALQALHVTVTAGAPVDSATTDGRAQVSGLSVTYDQTLPVNLSGSLPPLPGGADPPTIPVQYTGTVLLGSAGTVTGAVGIPDYAVTLPGAPLPPVSTPAGGSAGVPGRTVFLPGTNGSGGPLPGASKNLVTRSFGQSLQDWSLRAPYVVLVLIAGLTLVSVCRGAYRRLHAEEDM